MAKEKDNIVKKVCRELGITQKELAERLDVPPQTISGWATTQIPKMAQVALEQMIELRECHNKLSKIRQARDLIDSI